MSQNVIIDLGPMKRFEALIKRGFDGTSSGPLKLCFDAWATLYRSEMKQRFMRLSRSGGGDEWPPLKPSTIWARRHGKAGGFKRGRSAHRKAEASGGGQVSILWDTGILLATLNPQFGPGQIQRRIPNGIEIGIGGSATHPGSRLTVGQLAAIHHFGVPSRGIPARPIFVSPSKATVERMRKALEAAVKMAEKEANA